MGNKLADIFSDREIVRGKINFYTNEDKIRFNEALTAAVERGEVSKVNGIRSIFDIVSDGIGDYPLDIHNNVKEMWIGPSIDQFPVELKTISSISKKILFNRICLKDSTKIALLPGEIVSIVMELNRNTLTTHFEYKVTPQKAKSMSELAEAFSDAFGVLEYLFKPDNEITSPESADAIQSIKAFFRISYDYIKMMLGLENKYSINFDPKRIDELSNCAKDIEELYYLVCEKKKIRYDAEISSFETKNVEFTSAGSQAFFVGNKISVTFTQERVFSVLGENLTAYTANIFFNSIIKEILEDKNTGQKNILYSGTDLKPLYVTYSGYLTEAEAREELKLITSKSEEYSKAKTIAEYHQEFNKT